MLYLLILLGSYYMYWSYHKYCSDFWWIVLFIFITSLLFLLYVVFGTKVDCTVNLYYCTALPIICTVLKKVDRTVIFYCYTFLPIIHTVLKNQACNNYKYWSYNRNLRVSRYSMCSDAGG